MENIIKVNEGTLYEGWEGTKHDAWTTRKELKSLLSADFKKAGIKASIKFNRSSWSTSMIITMSITEEDIRTFDDFASSFRWNRDWYTYKDNNGQYQTVGHRDLFDLPSDVFQAMSTNIKQTSYKFAVSSIGTSSINKSILKDSALDRLHKLEAIVNSYNHDCSNAMIDYYERSIYDFYRLKMA